MKIWSFVSRFFRAGWEPAAGLYTYQVFSPTRQPIRPMAPEKGGSPGDQASGQPPREGAQRFHLRVHPDGSGVLFVDLADPLHLNCSATLLVWHALEGYTAQQAFDRLRRSIPKPAWPQLRHTVEAIFGWLDRLKSGRSCCAWHSLAEAETFSSDWSNGAAIPSEPVGNAEHKTPKTVCCAWAERKGIFTLPVQAPYKADVVVFYGCNNRCGHCYNIPGRRSQPPMSMRVWRQVVRKLVDLGVPQVILTGGEPTLCDDLPERIRLARQFGLVVGLNTNGRRLADPTFTARLAEAGLDHVQITLLSSQPQLHNRLCQSQGSEKDFGGDPFAETIRGIQNALGAGLHTLTNTTLTKHNAQEAESLVDFLYQLGIRTFAMNGIIRSGLGEHFAQALAEEELAPLLLRIQQRAEELGMHFLWYSPTRYCRFSPLELDLGPRRCNAAQYSICIEPNGDVLPCQSYYQPVGNLLRDPWTAIWHSPLFCRLRNRTADPAGCGLPEVCWECPDLAVCGGGCMLSLSKQLPVSFSPRSIAS